MFSDAAFDEDENYGGPWRGIFEQWLRRSGEPSLWGEVSGERYRFQTSAGGPGTLIRIESDPGEAVVKQFDAASDGWAVTQFRRSLIVRELDRLRRLITRAEFWAMPSPRPRYNVGLDGAHYLFEARVGERYHFVHRWSPHRDGFARLCEHCHSLYRSVVVPRRSWWRLWS
jgi:hypothetical protein